MLVLATRKSQANEMKMGLEAKKDRAPSIRKGRWILRKNMRFSCFPCEILLAQVEISHEVD